MVTLTRSLALLLIVVALTGCDRSPNRPVASSPATTTNDDTETESLEEFLLRKVRSAKLLSVSHISSREKSGSDESDSLVFDWTFGNSDFQVASKEDSLPLLIAQMLMGNDEPVSIIEGNWKLEMRDGAYELLLQDLKTDTGATRTSVPLKLFHPGPAIIHITGKTSAELMFRVDSE